MKEFRIWDSDRGFETDRTVERNLEQITVTIENNTYENIYIFTKHLPSAFFEAEPTYPVYTDTLTTVHPNDSEVTSVDGQVQINGQATWAAAHDAATGGSATYDHSLRHAAHIPPPFLQL
jgi:hypothetical protein